MSVHGLIPKVWPWALVLNGMIEKVRIAPWGDRDVFAFTARRGPEPIGYVEGTRE